MTGTAQFRTGIDDPVVGTLDSTLEGFRTETKDLQDFRFGTVEFIFDAVNILFGILDSRFGAVHFTFVGLGFKFGAVGFRTETKVLEDCTLGTVIGFIPIVEDSRFETVGFIVQRGFLFDTVDVLFGTVDSMFGILDSRFGTDSVFWRLSSPSTISIIQLPFCELFNRIFCGMATEDWLLCESRGDA